MTVSARTLRHMRLDAEMTIREFAAKVGYSIGYVCEIETGRKPLTPEIRQRFLAVYGLTTDDYREAM